MDWPARPLVLCERSLRRGWETGWGLALPVVVGVLTWLGGGNVWLALLAAVVLGTLFWQIGKPRLEEPPGKHIAVGPVSAVPGAPVWAQVRWVSSPRLPRVVPVVAIAAAVDGPVRQVFRISCGDAPRVLRADGVPFPAELITADTSFLRVPDADPVALRQAHQGSGASLSSPSYDDPPAPPSAAPLVQWWQRFFLARARALSASGPQWIPVHLVPAPDGFTTPWVVVRPSDGHVLARQYLPRALSGLPVIPHSGLLGVARGSAVLDEHEAGDSVDGLLYGLGWSNPVLLRGVRIRHVG